MKLSPTCLSTNTRHYGIDALRILSMFMVLVLHILGHGGILDATSAPNANYIAAWTLETLAFCAVNCYALISGYVMINAKYRYTNLILLWLQVLLFNLLATILFYFNPSFSVGRSDLVFAPFPALRGTFWYFSAYCGLYPLIPICNYAIHSLNRRQAKFLCGTIIAFFSVLPTLASFDPFMTAAGYSPFWLVLLYLLGACIRKFNFGANIKNTVLLGGYVLSVLISVAFLILLQCDIFTVFRIMWSEKVLIQYTSPTILINSIALLLLFTRIKITRGWIIKTIQLLSSVSFGVYILHLQPQVSDFLFLDKRFAVFADYPVPLMIAAVLLSAVVLFVFFGSIDKLRQILFEKLKLKKHLLALEERYIGDLWSGKKTK